MFDNIEWTLIAEDKASGTFKKVALSAKELSSASDGMTESVNKSNSSWQNIAKGVFAGGIALGAAKQAFDLLKGVVSDSIAQASEYQNVQAQLAAGIASTGGAAGITQAELNEMADSMANFVQGGSEGINAFQAQILTFTGITKENFEATTMAALDMSTRFNNGVLPTTEQLKTDAILLGRALNNPSEGLSILTRKGVEFTVEQQNTIKALDSVGDSLGAQTIMLNELTAEFGGSAAAAAETFQGRMIALTNNIDDTKKIIGQALLPTLSMLVSDTADVTGNIKVNDETMLVWQRRIFEVGVSVKTMIKIMGGFAGSVIALANLFVKTEQVIFAWAFDVVRAIANVGKNASQVFEAMKQAITGDFGGALDTLKGLVTNTFKTTIDYGGQLANAFGDVFSSVKAGMDNAGKAIVEMANDTARFDHVASKMNETANAATGTGKAMGGMGDATSEAADKANEALAKLQTDYKGAREKINTALMTLEEDHATNVGKIKDKLADLRTSLEETTSAYQKSMGEMNKSEAERVVEQEQTIADLQSQIEQIRNGAGAEGLQPQDQTQIDTLQAQLDKEKAAYDVYISERQGLETELSEARRRSQLTEFERFVEDINAKRTEEQAAYDAKLALIAGETLAQQTALAEENLVYETKKAMYAEVDAAFQAFHDKYLANMGDMRNYTSESVAVMAAELKRISDLFAEIQSLRSSAGLAGVSLGSPGEGLGSTAAEGTTDNSSVTTQVTNNITVQVTGDANAAAATVAEIQRQLELANLGST